MKILATLLIMGSLVSCDNSAQRNEVARCADGLTARYGIHVRDSIDICLQPESQRACRIAATMTGRGPEYVRRYCS